MSDLTNHLRKRAQELDLGRAEALKQTQDLLDHLWPEQTRAISLNGGVLKIITPTAAVASELRLRQIQLLEQIQGKLKGSRKIDRLHIQIRSFS